MFRDDFVIGMDSIGSFIEKLIKVFKDLYTFLKEQIDGAKK